jgi:Aspartyl protease
LTITCFSPWTISNTSTRHRYREVFGLIAHQDYWSQLLNTASRCAVAFALTVALGQAAFSHPPHPVEIPFEYSRAFGLMLIKVEVNGKPAVMVLDTGSNETIVSSRLVSVKQLSSKEPVVIAKGSGYSGNGMFATAFLSIGPVHPKNCQILVVDLSALSKSLGQEVDGILGMSVLKEFEVVSVDLKHHKLVLK